MCYVSEYSQNGNSHGGHERFSCVQDHVSISDLIRHLVVRCHKVSKPWDLYLESCDRQKFDNVSNTADVPAKFQSNAIIYTTNPRLRVFMRFYEKSFIRYWNGVQIFLLWYTDFQAGVWKWHNTLSFIIINWQYIWSLSCVWYNYLTVHNLLSVSKLLLVDHGFYIKIPSLHYKNFHHRDMMVFTPLNWALITDESHYNSVKFVMILHSALQWQWLNKNQTLHSQKTPHISPSWES